MNLHIEWTPIALQSLSEVFEYTFEEFGELQLKKLSRQIRTSVMRLSSFPQMGVIEEECSMLLGVEFRSVVVISEIQLFYTTTPESVIIEFVKAARLDDATMLARLSTTSL